MLRRKIRILSVIDDLHFGGDEYRLHAFAKSIDRSRFEHSVLTLMKEDPAIGEKYGSMRELYRKDGISLIDIGISAVGVAEQQQRTIKSALLHAGEKIRRLALLIREQKIDLLDVHLAPGNPVCAAAAFVTRIPFAVTLYQVNTMQSFRLWLAGQLNLGRAAVLITDSEVQAATIKGWLMHSPRVCVIANGITPPQPVLSKEAMFKLFDIPDRARMIIGQISSLVLSKGHLVLLDAAKKVLERNYDCFFLIVGYERGEPGYREVLLQRAASLGIADRVRVGGYPGPIGDIWNIIDIHVHASTLDSLPNALLEAMSLGKPSVITSIGGIPDVIEHKVNGFLAPPNDFASLADGLTLFLNDTNLREAVGRRAQSTYSKHFRTDLMTKRLEKEFENIAMSAR
jgi:glycosyltransferase involved in cell wall biosynthesis